MSERDTVAAPRRNARGEARRKSVIDAALRVVGEKGLAGLTHRAVATEADITPGLTTYYFPSVDDLLEATLSSFVEEELERLRAATDALEEAGPDANRESVLGAVFTAVAVEPAQQVAQFELYATSRATASTATPSLLASRSNASGPSARRRAHGPSSRSSTGSRCSSSSTPTRRS
jgi:DNA-binding transcriptional regulator YbjK